MISFTLLGKPITKKNHPMVIHNSNRVYVISSNAFKKYQKECRKQIDEIKGQVITSNVKLTARYYLPTKRRPDLINLLQATCDIISSQKKKGVIIWEGILADDKQIVGFGDSKIVGVDREEPRVEVKIEVVEGEK